MLAPRKITCIDDCIKFAIDGLNHGLQNLDAVDRLMDAAEVSSINRLDNPHPIGRYAVVYEGDTYKNTIIPQQIEQPQDTSIMVLIIVKSIPGKKPPHFYIDLAKRSLAGLEIENNRRPENKVWLSDVKFVNEDKAGEWWYSLTVVFPTMFVEEEIFLKSNGEV